MRLKFEVESDIDIPAKMKAIRDTKFWTFVASEWHRLYSPYVPMDTGTLKNTVDPRGKSGWAEIEHTAPYAHRMYEGHFNFRRNEGSPKASRQWDKAAIPTEKPKLIRSMQRYIDSGRVKF